MARQTSAILIITGIVVLANLWLLSDSATCDPEMIFSHLSLTGSPGLLPGDACFVDPAVGYITQPLGYLSAQDWLHGVVPWWNPYVGVGMPLAAEMQNESFFLPFVLLLHFHNGWLFQRILFQVLAGVFTYAFLIELGLGLAAAILGAALFSLNGTFILTAGVVTAPIFCLPLLLLGIENTRRAVNDGQVLGWSLVVVALALSIYSGFPELAYLDGLLGAVWALLRLLQIKGKERWQFLAKMCLGVFLGVAITGPVVLPFLQYLQNGNVIGHGTFFSHDYLPASVMPVQLLPMFYGTFAYYPPAGFENLFGPTMWTRLGGWLGCAPVLLALYALCRGPSRERLVLGLWILSWEAYFLGLPGWASVFAAIPGISDADAIRYAQLSVEFAVFVLAASGFEDIRRLPRGLPSHLFWPVLLFLCCLAGFVIPSLKLFLIWFHAYPELCWIAVTSFVCTIITMLVLVIAMRLRGQWLFVAQTLMIVGSILVFLEPQFCAPRSGGIDRSGIEFLSRHIGFSRLYTLGPFAPNFPAAYGIASINDVQLPRPQSWADYTYQRLAVTAADFIFGAETPEQLTALQANLPNYEAIGVKYVAAYPGKNPFLMTLANPLQTDGSFVTLSAGMSLSGEFIAASPQPPSVAAVAVFPKPIGRGATGPLTVQLCTDGQCVFGKGDLAQPEEGDPFIIPLNRALILSPSQVINYRFAHASGTPVALELGADLGRSQHLLLSPIGAISAGDAPVLKFEYSASVNLPVRVFKNSVMEIYQLPNPAPYAETLDKTCSLAVISRQLITTDCAHPTSLIRHELFYPGWHAKVNGMTTQVRLADGLFQTIDLPAGKSTIYFPTSRPILLSLALLRFWHCYFGRHTVF